MKNWFNTLIKKDPVPEPSVIKQIPVDQTIYQETSGLQRTSPIGQKKTSQPTQILKTFTPLRNLDELTLSQVPHKTLRYKEGSVIFVQGFNADAIYYLLSGTLELHPDTDDNFDLTVNDSHAIASYDITAGSPLSHLPLNNSKVFGATAIAKTTVDIITVSNEISAIWARVSQEKATSVNVADIELPNHLIGNPFFLRFTDAYRNAQLQLPSLPNVAFKLKSAMQQDIGIRDAVAIIQIDPVIVSKLIQVANSPLYASVKPINNCQDAVTRLGLSATRNLVMGISLKQLFQCKDKQIMTRMQAVWKQSLYVSSLSFVLAEGMHGVNPEEALLAGLINDIGIIPLLHFSELHADEFPSFDKILEIIPFLRGPVGRLVLQTLGFSKELIAIPDDAENWLYDSGEQIHLIDIVILAKLHSYFGTEKAKELPFINAIPAYSKLKDRKLSPDLSLALIKKAQQRINATMHLFS